MQEEEEEEVRKSPAKRVVMGMDGCNRLFRLLIFAILKTVCCVRLELAPYFPLSVPPPPLPPPV